MRRGVFLFLGIVLFSLFLSSVKADTIILRSNVTENLEDTYVANNLPNTNYGDSTIFEVRMNIYSGNTYIKFNITNITSPLNVINATLYLNISTAVGANVLTLKECANQTWDEHDLTWNNQLLCNDTITNTIPITGADSTFVGFNVTNTVKKFLGYKNVTFYLEMNTTNGIDSFYSGDSESLMGKPYLEITYNFNYTYTVTYDSSILSAGSDTISLQVINNTIINNATLLWNGTSYTPTVSSAGGIYTYSSTFTAPTVSSNTNVTFYWNIYANEIQSNTSSYNQTILFVGMDNCSSYTVKAMTFTLYNESTLTTMYGTLEMVFDLYLNPLVITTYSTKYQNNYTYSICLSANATNYTFDGYMSYYNTSGYATRTYWFYHAPLNNITQNVSLYLITSGESQEVTFTIKDSVGYPYPSLYVNLQRFFPALNSYNTIQIGKSDANGQLATYLIPYNAYYKMVLLDGNTILQTYSPFLITSNAMSFNVNTSYGSYLYKYLDKIAYSCSYNNVSLYFTCTITDTSGEVTRCYLDVMTVNTTNNQQICSVNGTSSSMTIGCYLGNTTGKTYFYSLYCNLIQGKTILERDFISGGSMAIIPSVPIYGLEGVFLSFMIIGTLAFIGFYINPMLGMILMFVGFFGCMAFGLLPIIPGVIVSMVLVGIIILWRIETL